MSGARNFTIGNKVACPSEITNKNNQKHFKIRARSSERNLIMAKKKEKVVEEKDETTRGMAKSGRFWKKEKVPFRKIQKKTKDQHLKLREEMKKIKALSNSIKEDKKQVRLLTRRE